MTKRLFFTLLILSLIAACVPPPTPGPTEAEMWWNDTVFYEIFVRSFYDSDGDGTGDINGIIEKLDYLNDGDPGTNTDLGVTGLWLMPIFPSPSYHGYDVTDYYSINPQYGTMDDFKRLLAEAHTRGIHIIIDMVLNHTSDQHPWFKEAKNDPKSKYRNWYIWSETDPGYKGPWNQRVWHPTRNGFYYGIFESFMPDLNYTNPQVTGEITDIFSFWLNDIGVDGFRLDAAKHLIEENTSQQNTTATHDWYRDFYPKYKSMKPDAMTIGEVFGDNLTVSSGYVNNREFDLIFNFQLASAFISSADLGKAYGTETLLTLSEKFIPSRQYAPFLSNHDQNRILSQLGGDLNKAKVAASLMLTSPGTPFIYYGEEIGMTGIKPDENIRRPMQWNSDQNAGFTTGKPWRQPDVTYEDFNVADQLEAPDSLLSHYRDLIHLRVTHSALRSGDFVAVETNHPGVFASLRTDAEETILIIINLSGSPVTDYSLELSGAIPVDESLQAILLLGDGQLTDPELPRDASQPYQPLQELPAYSTNILKIQP